MLLKWRDRGQPTALQYPRQPCTPAAFFLISIIRRAAAAFLHAQSLLLLLSTESELGLARKSLLRATEELPGWRRQSRGMISLSLASRPDVTTPVVSSRLRLPHLCTTRLRVLFHEGITFCKEFIFQLMTGHFSSLFTQGSKGQNWVFHLVTSCKIPAFDFPEAVYITLKLQQEARWSEQGTAITTCCAAVANFS